MANEICPVCDTEMEWSHEPDENREPILFWLCPECGERIDILSPEQIALFNQRQEAAGQMRLLP